MNSLEVLDIARQYDGDVIVASRHQEASDYGRTIENARLKGLQRLFALALQGDPDEDSGAKTEAAQSSTA
jgi:hypothetical protein